MSPESKLPNRRVTTRNLTFGERFGKPFADRIYQTPRFPDGVANSDLVGMEPEIQHETTLVWFLANFELARGAFFGFGEAQANTLDDAALGDLNLDGGATSDNNRTSRANRGSSGTVVVVAAMAEEPGGVLRGDGFQRWADRRVQRWGGAGRDAAQFGLRLGPGRLDGVGTG